MRAPRKTRSVTITGEQEIWREAHAIAAREIERIRSGTWGGGHEPHPGLAAAIANFAIAMIQAENAACMLLCETERDKPYDPNGESIGRQSAGRDMADHLACLIRERNK